VIKSIGKSNRHPCNSKLLPSGNTTFPHSTALLLVYPTVSLVRLNLVNLLILDVPRLNLANPLSPWILGRA